MELEAGNIFLTLFIDQVKINTSNYLKIIGLGISYARMSLNIIWEKNSLKKGQILLKVVSNMPLVFCKYRTQGILIANWIIDWM